MLNMTENKIERKKFLQLMAVGLGTLLIPGSLFAFSLKNEDSSYYKEKFRIKEPEWILHNDGTFDLITDDIRLMNCRPTIDGQSIFVRNTFMGDSPKGKRIIYEIEKGFVMIDLKANNGSVYIGAELSTMSRAPFWFCPLGEARIEGADRFFKQGFGTGGQSGIFGFPKSSPKKTENILEEQSWSYDSYLVTGLFSKDNNTLAVGAYGHYDFLQKSSVFNRPHSKGLNDQFFEKEKIFMECGFVMENIPLKDNFIKVPDIYFVYGTQPFKTLRQMAWNISENMVARKGTSTGYYWSSQPQYKNDFSMDLLSEQLQTLDRLKSKIPIRTILIDSNFCDCGDWMYPNDKWPRTMEKPAREIFQRGYRAGIAISPFLVIEASRMFKDHQSWLIRDMDKKPIPEFKDDEGNTFYALDCSNPNAQRYIARVFRHFRKIGYTFFKTNNLNSGLKDSSGIRRYDSEKSSVQIFIDILNIIREEIGAGSYWLADESPYSPLIGFADGVCVSNAVNDEWTNSVDDMLQETYLCQYFNDIFWQNDPGVINLSSDFHKMDDKEIKSIALWNGILGGVVHTSEKFSALNEESLNLFRFLQNSVRSKSAEIPCLFDGKKIKVLVYSYKSLQSWGVLFLNNTEEEQEEQFDIYNLVEEKNCWATQWEPFAAELNLGKINSITIKLQKHESQLFYFSMNKNFQENLSISGVKTDDK